MPSLDTDTDIAETPSLDTGARFDNSYARLPERFHVRMAPVPVAKPRLLKLNAGLAAELGIDATALAGEAGAAFAAGNALPTGAEPIALAYAGHQFGHFVPQLGDGRAILIGEVIDRAGRRRDLQYKGSGPTPFSRRGDGRAALGPVLREYLVSEAMHALGVPTTRALSAATTGEPVYRESVLPGAILIRVAASHVRVGTFQYFAARRDHEAIRLLADHVIARHHPEARDAERPGLALLEAVAEAQARLVARWMQVGFVHGVMNTDNTTISGETIDFGPCAFMDAYDPATVFSAIDQFGRYAYANQPHIANWNLARLAECILPLIDDDQERAIEMANATIQGFAARFGRHWLAGMRAKLGLARAEDGDEELLRLLLEAMHEGKADYTLTFRRLADAPLGAEGIAATRALFETAEGFDAWLPRWQARLAREAAPPAVCAAAMRKVNPAVIPRNHRVEQALNAAIEQGDLAPFEALVETLAHPYDADRDAMPLAEAPGADERVCRTFCGT
jgi:serine/tyrosine/threonine adenylyltransferase